MVTSVSSRSFEEKVPSAFLPARTSGARRPKVECETGRVGHARERLVDRFTAEAVARDPVSELSHQIRRRVADDDCKPGVRERGRAGRGRADSRAAEEGVVRTRVPAPEERERLARRERVAGRERVAYDFGRAVEWTRAQSPAREVERFGRSVGKLDEFVFGSDAHAVVIRVAGHPVGRVGEHLVDDERSLDDARIDTRHHPR